MLKGTSAEVPPLRPHPVTAGTSTATLKSTIETLVLRCQHTCTMVLPRCGAWRSSEVREALRSSSDSWSATVASSGDSADETNGNAFDLCSPEEGALS